MFPLNTYCFLVILLVELMFQDIVGPSRNSVHDEGIPNLILFILMQVIFHFITEY